MTVSFTRFGGKDLTAQSDRKVVKMTVQVSVIQNRWAKGYGSSLKT